MKTKIAAVLLCALTLVACNHNSLESSRGARAGCRVSNAEKRNAENVMAGLKNQKKNGSPRSPSPRRGC